MRHVATRIGLAAVATRVLAPASALVLGLAAPAAVRRAMGPDRTLGIRISADEYLAGGLTLDDMTDIVRRLVDAVQVDFVNVSHSAYHGS